MAPEPTWETYLNDIFTYKTLKSTVFVFVFYIFTIYVVVLIYFFSLKACNLARKSKAVPADVRFGSVEFLRAASGTTVLGLRNDDPSTLDLITAGLFALSAVKFPRRAANRAFIASKL